MESLTAVFVGVIVAVGGGIGLHFWQRHFLERVSVKRLRDSTDKYVQGLLDLYEEHFLRDEDDTNYSLSEVVEFINAKFEAKRPVDSENIILVAIRKDDVIGLLFCHFYPKSRKAIISYFATDKKNEARIKAADGLVLKLKKILIAGKRCDALFYESEGGDPTIPKPERREREARRNLFKLKAKAHGLRATEFKFPYRCARVSLADDVHERPFSLFCIGINEQLPAKLPKSQLLEYLRFIYLDCYGDFYPEGDPRSEEHRQYLRTMLEHYDKTLPEMIQAI